MTLNEALEILDAFAEKHNEWSLRRRGDIKGVHNKWVIKSNSGALEALERSSKTTEQALIRIAQAIKEVVGE